MIIMNAWLEPNGKVHPVKDFGHESYAYDTWGEWGDVMETRGFLHISRKLLVFVSGKTSEATQAQIDALWDIYMGLSGVADEWASSARADLRALLHITEA